ncbi:hypothetical protein TM074_01585 [Candidatus Nanosynbacter sp. TM7-074]|uniref:DUF2345 domain-containing protein n=1 Tax=Candidatus Nanosynbacter sp. TM7-074 TaxID=3158573 RepID=A0AB39J6B2_9BACT
MKNKDSDNRCEKEKGKKMTSKEEKPITFTLKDGNLVSIEGSRGVIQAVDEGRFYVRDGEDLDIKIGDDRLFALSGEVIITPDGSYIKVKGSDIQLKMGDKSILISRGTIRIFDNTGEAIIAGEEIVVKHGDSTIFTPRGDATIYRSSDMPRYTDKETLVHGWKIHAIVEDRARFIDSFTGYQEACVGTTSGGKFRFVVGVEYRL